MEIRPVVAADLDALVEIDGAIESSRYLHVDRVGEGLSIQWKLEERPLRTRIVEPNRLDDERRFLLRQIATGADEGVAVLAEHDGQALALLLAQPSPMHQTMKLIDLRVDFEYRRQGLGSGLVYQLIQTARDAGLRAVAAETRANHFPANQLMVKLGFELTGLDTQRMSNHDLVKESVTLFWYAALD
jgi:GNAT superfamily N-acetyltransferase